jgi:hypothetical protein
MDSDSGTDGVPRRWRGDGVERRPEAVDYIHGDEVGAGADAEVGPEAEAEGAAEGEGHRHPDTGEGEHVESDG